MKQPRTASHRAYGFGLPELPEAETIARGLHAAIAGTTIRRVEVRSLKNVIAPAGVDFARAVVGERVTAVKRRGKYVVFELRSGRLLVVGLRMTGRLVTGKAKEPPSTHVVLSLSRRRRVLFADVRTFGRMRLVEAAEPWDEALGVEPLGAGFTVEAFAGMLAGRKTPVKVLLLDQRRIAGIGNIYACEALWEAGIRPRRPSKSLTEAAAARLHRAVIEVLNRAIALRGSSIDDYVDARGAKGAFQEVLSVYGREGSPCPRCGKEIVRTMLGQRGTWWCRSCQH
ncbi:MAG: bifunctional DNA-formamidopyrimidine glycosylase/DNA-(apurinic or apyrimidinic site) lyase [Candidatus Tyrphobacter sp.]